MQKQRLYSSLIVTIFATLSSVKSWDRSEEVAPYQRLCRISHNDVTKSVHHVHNAFLEDHGVHPIHEEITVESLKKSTVIIGNFQFEGPRVFINFDKTTDLEFLFNLMDKERVSATPIGLKGNVHKSLLKASLGLKSIIINKLIWYCDQKGLKTDSLQLILGGRGRGSALATILAAVLLREVQVKSVQCITYGTLSIFDNAGALAYNSFVGAQNYLGFIAEEDFIRSYLSYSPVGTTILFSAAQSSSFADRVQKYNPQFSNSQVWAALTIKGIGDDKMQAHMPETYLEMIPKLYSEMYSLRRIMSAL